MKSFTNVIYDNEPEDISIWGKSVDVITDKRQIQITTKNGTTATKWEANVERYNSVEFARKTVAENNNYILAGNILLGAEE